MKRIFKLISLVLLLGVHMSNAAVLDDSVQVRNVFASMPDSILEIVSHNARLDCLDFFDSNMKSIIRNRMNGLIQVNALNKGFLQLQCADAELIGLKLLPYAKNRDGYLICVVTTLKDCSDYSTIRIFDQDWKELALQDYVTLPPLESFVVKKFAKKDSIALLEQKLPFISYAIELDSCTDCMHVSLTSQSQLSLEDSAYFSKWFGRDCTVDLKWNGKLFK